MSIRLFFSPPEGDDASVPVTEYAPEPGAGRKAWHRKQRAQCAGIVHSGTLRINETTFTPPQRAGKYWNYSGLLHASPGFSPTGFRVDPFILAVLMVKSVHAGVVFSASLHDGDRFSIAPLFAGGLHENGATTGGWIHCDTITGQGAFDLTATVDMIGAVQIYNTSITTNANGSLHLDGWVRFGGPEATGYQVFGDMVVGYEYEWEGDYTVFTFSPIAYAGLDQAGLFMPSGPFAGHVLDFKAVSSFLAYEENPFPEYAAVPLPAAAWLLISGFLLMLGAGRNR